MIDVTPLHHGLSELPSHGPIALTWNAPDAFSKTYIFIIGASFPNYQRLPLKTARANLTSPP